MSPDHHPAVAQSTGPKESRARATMDGKVTELGYLGIGVSDIEAWKVFASEVLGLEITPGENSKFFSLRMDYWFQRFLVFENGADDLEFAGWRVADEASFDQLCTRLKSLDIPHTIASPQQASERRVLGLLTLSDPAGVQTEIFYGPRVEPALPFYPGRRMHGSFVTGAGGMGHFVTDTANMKACEKFYREVFGMRGSVEFERALPPEAGGQHIRMTFMNCNERQHSIAFGNLGGKKRLVHVMGELSDLADVGFTRDIVKRRKIPVLLDIGQHHNDRVVSFYFETPSGWHWECGWGGVAPPGQAEWAEAPIWGHEHMPSATTK